MTRSQALAEVTVLLQAWGIDTAAREQVFEALYGDLRRRAARHIRRERAGHTLSPTALVHEGYLRMSRQAGPWRNREQFLAVASRVMRRILVDWARARQAGKRAAPVQVEAGGLGAGGPDAVDLIDLDDALAALGAEDERAMRLVELRFFGGLTHEEAAAALGVSTATAARDWTYARAWLFRRLRTNAPR